MIFFRRLYEWCFRIDWDMTYEPFADDVKTAWWVIDEDSILNMLHRVANGEDPGHVMAEHYANSEVEHA